MFEMKIAARGNERGHRTGQPVRRNSRHKGRCEQGFWTETNRQTLQEIVLGAKRYDKAHKEKGKSCGPLGSIAIEILEYMANLVDFKTGRLEPSIATMMAKLRRSRGAICKALDALERHGFLQRMRRFEPLPNAGKGPQVKQSSNAYRLSLPQRAIAALGRFFRRRPTEDKAEADLQTLRMEAEDAIRQFGRDAIELLAKVNSIQGRKAAMYLKLVPQRESTAQTEPDTKDLIDRADAAVRDAHAPLQRFRSAL
jgi:hypothetical protein